MAWVPIQSSSVEYSFDSDDGTLVDSVATLPAGGGYSWTINLPNRTESLLVRATPIAYAANEPASDLMRFYYSSETGNAWVGNASATPNTSWEPSPTEFTIGIDGGEFGQPRLAFQDDYFSAPSGTTSFLIEVWEEAAPTPGLAWVNAFDLGECTVTVYDINYSTTAWSGVLGKGDSVDFEYDFHDCTISVSSAGAVTLAGLDQDSNGAYRVTVTLAEIPDAPARVRDITLPPYADMAEGIISTQEMGILGLDTVDPPSPDPLDMSELTEPPMFVGMAFFNTGIG